MSFHPSPISAAHLSVIHLQVEDDLSTWLIPECQSKSSSLAGGSHIIVAISVTGWFSTFVL